MASSDGQTWLSDGFETSGHERPVFGPRGRGSVAIDPNIGAVTPEGPDEKSTMSMHKGRRFGTYVGLLRFIPLIPHLPKVIRLGWRLFRDRRVPFYLKGMVVAALLYVLSPFDFISEIVFPGLGYLDDATLLLLASYLFMRWSPQEVVAEHVAALGERFRRRFQRWRAHFPAPR